MVSWLVLLLAAVIHLLYFLFVYLRLAFYKPEEKNIEKEKVSVIICAKNESANLDRFLHTVLEQSYPDYEVIVVNDGSWDDTAETLKKFSTAYSHLRIVTIPEQDKYKHGKKFAVTLGVKAAASELLLFTDADCMPVSKNWISLMQRNFSADKEIVLGYGSYMQSSSFLNRLIRFDAFAIALTYFSFALKGNAYMGVGRNLAYRKSLFFRNKGFAKHYYLLSGDDDLFVNECANRNNTAIELNPDSFTRTDAVKSFSSWMKQKARHGKTASLYKTRHKWQLFFLHFSNLLFFILLITLLILRYDWRCLLTVYLSKLLVQWCILIPVSKKLKEINLMWYYPVLEFIHVFLVPLFYINSIITKQRAWK